MMFSEINERLMSVLNFIDTIELHHQNIQSNENQSAVLLGAIQDFKQLVVLLLNNPERFIAI